MTIRTVTYDDMCETMLFANGNMSNKYYATLHAAPPFTSLPNTDLDVIEQALHWGLYHARLAYGPDKEFDINNGAIAALKRLKGDV